MGEKLTELVKQFEELSDLTSRRHSDSLFKDKLWNIIERNNPRNSKCITFFILDDTTLNFFKNHFLLK